MYRKCLFVAIVLGCVAACGGVDDTGSDQNAQGTRPTCSRIASVCHESVDATGQDCHEQAHLSTTTEEQCQQMQEECIGICGEGGGHAH